MGFRERRRQPPAERDVFRAAQPRIVPHRSSLWYAARLEMSFACEQAAGGWSLDSAVSQAASDIHCSERLNRGHSGR